MSESFFPTPIDLYIAQHNGFKKLVEIEMPSLRIVHDFQYEEFKFGYAGYHSGKFFWIRPGGGEVDPRVRDIGSQWCEMFNAPISPGYISRFFGRLSPQHQLPATLSPAYLASTAMLISDWPIIRECPDYETECVTLALRMREREGTLHVFREVSMPQWQKISRGKPVVNDLLKKADDHWSHLCEKMAPWLADSGISYLEVKVPMNHDKRSRGSSQPTL